jgi:hypothetical protein
MILKYSMYGKNAVVERVIREFLELKASAHVRTLMLQTISHALTASWSERPGRYDSLVLGTRIPSPLIPLGSALQSVSHSQRLISHSDVSVYSTQLHCDNDLNGPPT